MGNIGFNTRNTRMLQIVKGCNLTDASKQTAAFKLVGGSVLSGEPMIVARSTGSNAGDAETVSYNKVSDSNVNTGKPVAFAFTDSDSFDVQAAGSILGVSALDTFELQTALYDAAATYAPGDKLIVLNGGSIYKNDTTGDVIVAADGTITGFTKIGTGVAYVTKLPAAGVADANYDVIGTVTEGVVSLKGNVAVAAAAIAGSSTTRYGNSIDPTGYVNVEATATDPRLDVVSEGGPALWTEATHTKNVLQFATTWEPQFLVPKSE